MRSSIATYFPRLATARHAFVDWSWGVETIARFIGAFDAPYDGAGTFHRGKRVTLRDTLASQTDGTFHSFMAGLIIRKYRGALTVAAHDGAVVIRTVRAADGSDAMPALRPGHRLVTPRSILDDALTFEAVYDAHGLRADASQPQPMPVWHTTSSPSTSAP